MLLLLIAYLPFIEFSGNALLQWRRKTKIIHVDVREWILSFVYCNGYDDTTRDNI